MTTTTLLIALAVIAIAALIWVAIKLANVGQAQKALLDADTSAKDELAKERDQYKEEAAKLRGQIEGKTASDAVERQRLAEIEKLLKLQVKAVTTKVLGEGGQKLASDAKKQVEAYMRSLDKDDEARKAELAAMVAPLKEALEKVEKTATEQSKGVGSIQETIRTLGKTTDTLYNALQNPTARGAWGEFTLERVAELSGMSSYCDYDTQVTVSGDEGRLRPDMVVHLPGGRQIVIDSKVSLKDYMKAVECVEEEDRATHLSSHAASVKNHIKNLSSKKYHQQFPASPDFVVMYIPGEMFYHAALKEDASIFDFAARNRVVIATPMILMALLRIVAQGWHDAQLAENAIAIRDAGIKVYDQLRIVAERIAKVGDRISQTSDAYNTLVTGFDGRLWSRAQTLSEMGCGDEPLKREPEQINVPLKRITRLGGDGQASQTPELHQSSDPSNSQSDRDVSE